MKEFKYKLICKGKSKFFKLLGVYHKLEKEQDRIYYSKEKTVFAKNEELARVKIRGMLKNKWTGFIIIDGGKNE